MVQLSIIIVSFNQIQILCNCLDSIKRYNDIGDNLEIIVSDNSPDNNLFNFIHEHYNWVKLVKNDNIGFGAGNNRGYEVSSGEFLLFLNPDTVLVEPIFDFAIKKFNENPNLSLFGLRLVDKDLSNNTSFAVIDSYKTLASAFKARKAIKRLAFKDDNMLIIGADLFIRRKSFEEAGKFDENIFMYREEEDLIKRIKLYSSAKKIAFYPEKTIIHLEGGTEETSQSNLYNKLLRENITEKYYTTKWGLDLDKISKIRIKYLTILMIIQYIIFQWKKANIKKETIKIYKSFLQEKGDD